MFAFAALSGGIFFIEVFDTDVFGDRIGEIESVTDIPMSPKAT